MADWTKLTEYLLNIPEGSDTESLAFDKIEVIIEDRLPTSSAERWFWVNTPHRWYSRYWRNAGWHIGARGVDLASRLVEFVRVKEEPIPAWADMGAVERGERRPHAPVPRSSEIQVPLTDNEFKELGSLNTAKRAVAIVKKHLREKHSGRDVEILEDVRGADIRVVFRDKDEEDEIIEVKGTVQPSIAWSQLKVSLQSSYDALVKGVPMYRVIGVNSKIPRIVVLRYGKDFMLAEELRWAVRPVSS